MASTEASVVLRSPDEWYTWFDNIRNIAKRNDVFECIDPSKEEEDLEAVIKKPKQPVLEDPEPNETKEQEASRLTRYTNQNTVYSLLEKNYRRQRTGLNAVDQAIRTSVDPCILNFIRNDESLYKSLCKLQERYKPTEDQYGEIILQRFKNACATPIKSTTVLQWINKVESAYFDCEAAELSEVTAKNAIKRILKATKTYDRDWTLQTEYYLTRNPSTVPEILRNLSLKVASKTSEKSSAAFATLNNQPDTGNKPKRSLPTCLCGSSHLPYFSSSCCSA
ncbi:hypothetical protein BDW42DRAFT_161577 [Aspergillus taichungensis]|uniref:Uncharacterized protein n=1 Tax=Aspergillus taichungensis TaxID=482145 RepID=A0A2J5I5M3_9EURO|nr:hypothetical protein BDW42DRAFT_161577 [Aspergillus taichungensis]